MAMPEYTGASGQLDHASIPRQSDALDSESSSTDEARAGYHFVIDAKMFLDDNQRCTRFAVGIRTI